MDLSEDFSGLISNWGLNRIIRLISELYFREICLWKKVATSHWRKDFLVQLKGWQTQVDQDFMMTSGWRRPETDKTSAKIITAAEKLAIDKLLLHSCLETCPHDSVWLVSRRLQHDYLVYPHCLCRKWYSCKAGNNKWNKLWYIHPCFSGRVRL